MTALKYSLHKYASSQPPRLNNNRVARRPRGEGRAGVRWPRSLLPLTITTIRMNCARAFEPWRGGSVTSGPAAIWLVETIGNLARWPHLGKGRHLYVTLSAAREIRPSRSATWTWPQINYKQAVQIADIMLLAYYPCNAIEYKQIRLIQAKQWGPGLPCWYHIVGKALIKRL